jgi:hypothetical protein
MKLTLLNMVQNILSSMDSDNVNSISDTEEALQVAEVLKETYYEIIARHNWAFMFTMQNLEGVGDTTKPTKLRISDNLQRVHCLRYKTQVDPDPNPKWTEMLYLQPCDFLDRVQRINTVNEVVETTNDDGVEMYIVKDRMPRYWTSFDDEFIYLDSFDESMDTTLQASKTSVRGVRRATWTVSDTFVPDMPEEMFILLLNEAKSIVHLNMKQQPNLKAEQIARRQFILMREQEPTVKPGRDFVNYGKRTASRGRSHTQWKGTPTSSGIRIEIS